MKAEMKYLQHTVFTFLFLIMLTPGGFAQSPADFNGWEFLDWTLSKGKVEEALKGKGIPFDPGTGNEKGGPVTEFEYQRMETRLAYDVRHLYDVQQGRYFREEEKDSAIGLFDEVYALQISRYGEPGLTEREEERGTDHYQWKTKYNVINLYFHHCKTCSETPGMEGWAYNVSLQTNEL